MQDSTIIEANLDGTTFRTRVNDALLTLSTAYYGTADPANSATLAVGPGTLWWDESQSPPVLKVRNATDTAWVELLDLAGAPGAPLQTVLDGYLSLAGGTMTGALTLSGAPTLGTHAATKTYVDSLSRPAPVRFAVAGSASVSNKVASALLDVSGNVSALRAWADTAPVGAALVATVVRKRAGSADDSRSISVTAGQNAASLPVSPVMAVAAGDRLQLDITGVGSTTPGGNDLLVTATVSP